MRTPPLKPAELDRVRSVLRPHPEVKSAKGTHRDRCDVDLVVAGDVEPLRAEAIDDGRCRVR